MEKAPEYSKQEMMIACAARELRNGDTVFVGIGLPNMAANLARRLHAPEVRLIYESGIYGASPERWPQSIGDPCLVANSLAVHSMSDLFLFYLQGGRIDVGFLGGAQIDRYGNINSTVIGDYRYPKVRLPGSGGACEIALLSKKVLVIIPQVARLFPKDVDFVTSPGRNVPGKQWTRSDTYGRGPVIIVTDMAVFDFNEKTEEMEIISLHPGVTLAEVRRNMGWEASLAERVTTTPAPTEADLAVIREQLKTDERVLVG